LRQVSCKASSTFSWVLARVAGQHYISSITGGPQGGGGLETDNLAESGCAASHAVIGRQTALASQEAVDQADDPLHKITATQKRVYSRGNI